MQSKTSNLEKVLKQIDEQLFQRYKLILALINYPTVYVEMQSFLQCCFKTSINGDYLKYDISCYVKNAKLSKYLYSEVFTNYFSRQFGFSDFNKLEDLNYLANKHKHDESVAYNKAEVESYFKTIYDLAKKYCEKNINCDIEPYTILIFDEASRNNDIDRLNDNIEILTEELNNTKKALATINNDQDLAATKKTITELEQIIKTQKDECETLKKQVKELSNQVKYTDENLLAFKLSSTITASEVVELKRKGLFKESLFGYIAMLEKTNYAYDYNTFWGMFKVALLLKELKLAKGLLFSIFHYEFNYFTNTMNNKDSNEQTMLLMQIKQFMGQNREFEQLFREGLEEKQIPSIAVVSVYSVNLMNAYYHLVLAESHYNSSKDNFGDVDEQVKAYFEQIQSGNNSTPERQYHTNDAFRLLTKTALPLSLIMIMFNDEEFSFKFENLAIGEIYKIKQRIDDVKERYLKSV